MTATISALNDGNGGYLITFNNGHEQEVHLEELLALCLNSVHAYTRQSYMLCSVEHRQAMAALHDSLQSWLGLQDDAPRAFRYSASGAVWLDALDDGFVLNCVEFERGGNGEFNVRGGHSFSMGREHCASVVTSLCESLLSGNVEVGDALALKSKVCDRVAQVTLGRQVRRVEDAMILASYVATNSTRQDRGCHVSNITSLAQSEHETLLETCGEISNSLTPAIAMQGARELDQLRLAAQQMLMKLSNQMLDTVHASALFKQMQNLGVGVKLAQAPRTVADMKAECARLARMTLEQVANKIRIKLQALTGDIVVVEDHADLYGDSLGQIFYSHIESAIADPNNQDLEQQIATRINKEVDRWWNKVLGEAFEKNALRALVTSKGKLFGAVAKITPRSNIANLHVYPIRD